MNRGEVQPLGLVLGVLVVMEDGLHLCTLTPEGLREGDFVRVQGDEARIAVHLDDTKRINPNGGRFYIANRLLALKARYLKAIQRGRERERVN